MRTNISHFKNKGCCGPFKRSRCENCKHIVPTKNFILFTTKLIYKIRPENLNCAFKNAVCFISCKTCHKQYIGSSERFSARFNNYRCAHRNYRKIVKAKK